MKLRLISSLMGLFACGAFLSSCSESAAPPTVTTGPITVFHANADLTSPVNFVNDTTTIASSVAYGQYKATTVSGTPSTSVTAKATGGTSLGSSSMTVDSASNTWIIFCGDLNNREVFTSSSKKAYPAAGEVGVRFVNASYNSGTFSLRLGSATGSDVATSIGYKGTSTYRTIPASTTTLVATDAGVNQVTQNVTLTPLKTYTVIMYGSTTSGATNKPTLLVQQD